MLSQTKNKGKIITFYSYKGGTGRSMALANVACLLSKETDGKILMIDWDLEAPGLYRYFTDYLPNSFSKKKGLIDFFIQANEELPTMPLDEEDEDVLDRFFTLIEKNINNLKKIPGLLDNLYLMSAGQFEDENEYSDRVAKFNWQAFFQKIPAFFTRFANYLSQHYSYVLIDSRTGHTDIGGICTMLMPEKLILVFTPNYQSLEGVLKLAVKATNYRRKSDDLRSLSIYPLPSRIELNEVDLRNKWQKQYTDSFTKVFREIYDLPKNISLTQYFEQVQIRRVSKYAYGEEIAVIKESTRDINSLAIAYEAFVAYLTSEVDIWKYEFDLTYQNIKELIEKDNLREAIELMIEKYPTSHDIIQLNGRLSSTQRQNSLGIISHTEYIKELNRIAIGILSILDDNVYFSTEHNKSFSRKRSN